MRIKTGLACLASVASAAGVSALVPSAAQAHPCAVNWSLSTSTFLSANDSGTSWAGSLPTRDRRRLGLRGRRDVAADRPGAERRRGGRPGRGDQDVHQEREHDADRLLGADPAAGHGQQPRRHQLRHRVQGQPRLPGPLERLPGDRHLRSDEPDADLQHRGVPAHVRPGRRRRARQHPRAHVGLGRTRPAPTRARRAPARRSGTASRASTSGTSRIPPRRCTSASCGCRRPATRPAPRPAAARTPRPACRTTRAATSTSTSAARAAPARASTSSASRSRTRRTRCT